jgi:hypothetical protein
MKNILRGFGAEKFVGVFVSNLHLPWLNRLTNMNEPTVICALSLTGYMAGLTIVNAMEVLLDSK